MSEHSKHTPGPWRVVTKTSQFGVSGPMMESLHVYSDSGGIADVENELNARLAASAPELLEACKLARRTIGILAGYVVAGTAELDQVMANIDAAIAKATGGDS